jgi:nucleoid-associated protein YgaU
LKDGIKIAQLIYKSATTASLKDKMPTRNTKKTSKATSVKVSRPAVSKPTENSYLDRIESEIKSNQSTVSLILGVLIVIVLGVLVFNYFNKNSQPAIQESATTTTEQAGDVSPENLPGKYTVKEGDTLFIIADKYYKDGLKYSEIVKTNNLANENSIEVGQVLDIPKLEEVAAASPSPTATAVAEASAATPTPTQQAQASPSPTVTTPDNGTGGANTTIWGPQIQGDTYTVAEGDWLSTISARAYGDIMSFDKIAKANNITDPNIIQPGTVLKLPR